MANCRLTTNTQEWVDKGTNNYNSIYTWGFSSTDFRNVARNATDGVPKHSRITKVVIYADIKQNRPNSQADHRVEFLNSGDGTLWSSSKQTETIYSTYQEKSGELSLNYVNTEGANVGELKNGAYKAAFRMTSLLGRQYRGNNSEIEFVYTPPTYRINVSSNNTNYGTVSGGGTFNVTVADQTKTITATPKAGCRFVRWLEDGNTSSSREITISQNNISQHSTTKTYTAEFEQIERYPITFNMNDGQSFTNKFGVALKEWTASNGKYSKTVSGLTATYDPSDDSFTFNGTTSDYCNYEFMPLQTSAGENYTIISKHISGSKTGSTTPVMEFAPDMTSTLSTRVSADIPAVAVKTIDATSASSIKGLRLWVYCGGSSTYSNYKISIAVVKTSGNADTPCGCVGRVATPKTIEMPAPTRAGYRFIRWTQQPNVSTSWYGEDTIFPSASEVYAYWSLITYSVKFKNADGSTVSSKTINEGKTLGTLPTVSRSGYEFGGWIPCQPAKKMDNAVLDSMAFNGNDTFFALSQSYKYTDKFSMHIEAYMDDWSDIVGRQIISCTEGGGWGLGYGANTVGKGAEIHTGSYNGIDLGFGGSTFADRQWYKFDVVFNNGNFKVYVNDTQKGSVTTAGTTAVYNSNNTIFVGAEAGTSATTPPTNKMLFKGIISNVFIANQGTKLEVATASTVVNDNVDYYPIWRKLPTNNCYVGGQKIREAYVGSQKIKEIYVGATRVY